MYEVYIIVHMSKTWTEILGVYSTQEKAESGFGHFHKQIGNCFNLRILVRKVDEMVEEEMCSER